jgi:undecaprenyl-diphosphatase
MNTIEAVVLGTVQGLTEFIPVSSSAHLRIVPALLGWDDPGAAFTAVLQLGSLVAVIGYFLKDLIEMARASIAAITDRLRPTGGAAKPPSPAARHLLYIIVGTIPVAVLGTLLKHRIENDFRALAIIAAAQIVFGLLLGVADMKSRKTRTFDDIILRDAIIIGCAQALALVPGASRSGVTLIAALALGFERAAAARFSFLLSVPAVAGAGLKELHVVLHARDVSGSTLAIGLAVTVVVSYASIAWLLKFLRTRTMVPFAVYRVALGALIFALLAAGRL